MSPASIKPAPLKQELLPTWLPEAGRLALLGLLAPEDEASALALPETQLGSLLVAAGQLLRTGALPGGARITLERRLRELNPSAVAAQAKALFDRESQAFTQGVTQLMSEEEDLLASRKDAPSADGARSHEDQAALAWRLLAIRDNLESLSWAASLARHLPPQTSESDQEAVSPDEADPVSIRARLRRADQRTAATAGPSSRSPREGLARALRTGPRLQGLDWLTIIARRSGRSWWSDLVLASLLRPGLDRFLSRPFAGLAFGHDPRLNGEPLAHASTPLQFLLPDHLRAPSSLNFAGGSSGSELDQILAQPLGPPLCHMFEGEVLVHAHGLAEHDPESPTGLVLRHRDGEIARLGDARLDPPGDQLPTRSELALAIWVPLSGLVEDRYRLSLGLRDPQEPSSGSLQEETILLNFAPARDTEAPE